jgi:hypothetical protein
VCSHLSWCPRQWSDSSSSAPSLITALSDVADGRGRAALLLGEAGMGKPMLADWLVAVACDEVARRNVLLLAGDASGYVTSQTPVCRRRLEPPLRVAGLTDPADRKSYGFR